MHDAPAAVGDRAGFLDVLGALREQGALDARDEADLVRQFDDTLDAFQDARKGLLTEYERRTAEQGSEAADAWLGEAAQALGREQGARLGRLLSTLPALAGSDG